MKRHAKRSFQGSKGEFVKIIRELCYSRQPWEVWSDVITVMACSIANAVDKSPKRHENREKEYAECIKRLGGVEKPAQLFAILVEELEAKPDQDFLGELYMTLELGNHWKGQFFTPYNICQLMSEMTMGDCQKAIEKDGWISICDPCIGSGAMMIAAVHTLRHQNVYYHNHVLFVGQDIDRVVGMMAYIQLSLLGCPGYIVIANTMTNPIVGSPLMPIEKEGQEFWYTPLYFSEVWHFRRAFSLLKNISGTGTTQKTVEKERYFMFFDFKEQEVEYGNQRN